MAYIFIVSIFILCSLLSDDIYLMLVIYVIQLLFQWILLIIGERAYFFDSMDAYNGYKVIFKIIFVDLNFYFVIPL